MKKLIYTAVSVVAVLVAIATMSTAPIITALAIAIEFFTVYQANK